MFNNGHFLSTLSVGCNNRQSKDNTAFYAKTHKKEEEMEMDDGRSMEILSAICICNRVSYTRFRG